jgi:hypothetical protein
LAPGEASERFVCAYLEHHAAAAARGALATLQEAWLSGEYQGSARATGARQLAQRLLRLVRGAVSFFLIFVRAIRVTSCFVYRRLRRLWCVAGYVMWTRRCERRPRLATRAAVPAS